MTLRFFKNPLKNKRKGGTIEKTSNFAYIQYFRRMKICRDPEEDQEEAAEAADLVEALAEAEASAAEAADLAEVADRTITDPITAVIGVPVITAAEQAALAV